MWPFIGLTFLRIINISLSVIERSFKFLAHWVSLQFEPRHKTINNKLAKTQMFSCFRVWTLTISLITVVGTQLIWAMKCCSRGMNHLVTSYSVLFSKCNPGLQVQSAWSKKCLSWPGWKMSRGTRVEWIFYVGTSIFMPALLLRFRYARNVHTVCEKEKELLQLIKANMSAASQKSHGKALCPKT